MLNNDNPKQDLNPIIIIGSARSGTTILGKILSKHPNIAYWVEPKYIWKYRNPNINNDIREASEATDLVAEYIRRKFLKYQYTFQKKRFMEKTPSNRFRISFINEVYPDAIFINIIRDGRDVALSAYKKWTEPHDKSAYSRRFSLNDLPLKDLPYYICDFLRQFIIQQFIPEKLKKWGPISPEIIKYSKKSVEEACAFQWKQCTEKSLKDFDKISSERVITFKYEDFLKSPEKHLEDIFSRTSLKYSQEVIDYANQMIKKNNSYKWRNKENIEFIEKVGYILNPCLKELKYKL